MTDFDPNPVPNDFRHFNPEPVAARPTQPAAQPTQPTAQPVQPAAQPEAQPTAQPAAWTEVQPQGPALAKRIPKIRMPGQIDLGGGDEAKDQALEAAAQRLHFPGPIEDEIAGETKNEIEQGSMAPLYETPALDPWLGQKEQTPEEAWEESLLSMQWDSSLMRADVIAQANYFSNDIMAVLSDFIVVLGCILYDQSLFIYMIGITICLCWRGILLYWQIMANQMQEEIRDLEHLLPEKKLEERWQFYTRENIYEDTTIDLYDWYLRWSGRIDQVQYRFYYWLYGWRRLWRGETGILVVPFLRVIAGELPSIRHFFSYFFGDQGKRERIIHYSWPYVFIGLDLFLCIFLNYLRFY